MAAPPNVAAGELIESAWGNDVVANFNVIYGRLALADIHSGGGTFATDTNGIATVPLGYTYSQPPIIAYAFQAGTGGPIMTQVYTRHAHYFTVLCHWGSGAGIGTAYASQSISLTWIAMLGTSL